VAEVHAKVRMAFITVHDVLAPPNKVLERLRIIEIGCELLGGL